MKHETAGDPISGLKWTRRATEKIAKELKSLGIEVSRTTVARLLKELKYSLKVNHKKRSSGSPADRNEQFEYIAEQRQRFARRGAPILSIDSKKKEMVGNFKNAGRAWNRDPVLVNDHDFRSHANGMATPYGVYDVQENLASVFVGVSYDTPEFAADSIERWWRGEGRKRYPGSKHLLLLADGGGSNGYRCRAWKLGLQEKLCDRHGLTVSVSHYPTGTSKWNPIEHRLFSQISKNWEGKPLNSYETILKYIRTTRTTTGLRVRSSLVRKEYEKGVKISDDQMAQLRDKNHATQPLRNCTLRPRQNGK